MFYYALGIFSTICAIYLSSLESAHFSNVESTDQVRSGQSANVSRKLGIADSPHNAVLIDERVAITNSQTQLEKDDEISFNGQQYKIINKIFPKNVEIGVKDFCLLILDRVVEGIRPRSIVNMADNLGDMVMHFFTRNKTMQMKEAESMVNPNGDLAYGRMYVEPKASGATTFTGSSKVPTDVKDLEDLVTPSPGDEGSAAFASIEGKNELALAGIMSKATRQGTEAVFTALSPYRDEIEFLINKSLGGNALPGFTDEKLEARPNSLTSETMNLLPMDFSLNNYLSLNPDLQTAFGSIEDEAVRTRALYNHYLTNGKNEIERGRAYMGKLFNPYIYIEKYDDLRTATSSMDEREKALWGIRHYVSTRLTENRSYLPEGFDWEQYLENYVDLQETSKRYAFPKQFALEHYTAYGFNEGRGYKPLSTSNPLPPEASTTESKPSVSSKGKLDDTNDTSSLSAAKAIAPTLTNLDEIIQEVKRSLSNQVNTTLITPVITATAAILSQGRGDKDVNDFVRTLVEFKAEGEVNDRDISPQVTRELATLSEEGVDPRLLVEALSDLVNVDDQDISDSHRSGAKNLSRSEDEDFNAVVSRMIAGLEKENGGLYTSQHYATATKLVENFESDSGDASAKLQRVLLFANAMALADTMLDTKGFTLAHFEALDSLESLFAPWVKAQNMNKMLELSNNFQRDQLATAIGLINKMEGFDESSVEQRVILTDILFDTAEDERLQANNVNAAIKLADRNPVLAARLLSIGFPFDDKDMVSNFLTLGSDEKKENFAYMAYGFINLAKDDWTLDNPQSINGILRHLIEAESKGNLNSKMAQEALYFTDNNPALAAKYLALSNDTLRKDLKSASAVLLNGNPESKEEVLESLFDAISAGRTINGEIAARDLKKANANPIFAARMMGLPSTEEKSAFFEACSLFAPRIQATGLNEHQQEQLAESLLDSANNGLLSTQAADTALRLTNGAPLAAAYLVKTGLTNSPELTDKYRKLHAALVKAMPRMSLARSDVSNEIADALIAGYNPTSELLINAIEITREYDRFYRPAAIAGLLKMDSIEEQDSFLFAVNEAAQDISPANYSVVVDFLAKPEINLNRLTPMFIDVLTQVFDIEAMKYMTQTENITMDAALIAMMDIDDSWFSRRRVKSLVESENWDNLLLNVLDLRAEQTQFLEMRKQEEDANQLINTLRFLNSELASD